MRLTATKRLDLEQDRARRVVARFAEGEAPLVLALAVQASIGFVPKVAIPEIAQKAHLESKELTEALEADQSIRLEPPGEHRITICTGTTCAPRGGASMVKLARRVLGINLFTTTPDETIRLDSQKCLGRCAMAPNVRIDGKLRGAMDEKRFGLLLGVLGRMRD